MEKLESALNAEKILDIHLKMGLRDDLKSNEPHTYGHIIDAMLEYEALMNATNNNSNPKKTNNNDSKRKSN